MARHRGEVEHHHRHAVAIPAHEAQHGFDQPLHVPQTVAQPPADVLPLRRRQVRARQLAQVQRCRRQGRADLVSKAGGHFAERREALLASELFLQFVHLGRVGDQHHAFAAVVQLPAVHGKLPRSGFGAGELGVAFGDVPPGPAEQRLAKHGQRGGVGVADRGIGIQDQDAARQHRQQRGEAAEQAFLLGQLLQPCAAAAGEFRAQAQHLLLQAAIAAVELTGYLGE